jgi:rare lipoprotein A
MQFFGLVWVTSWVSYILTSSQGLFKVPDYLVSAFPANLLSVVNSPTELPTPLVSTPLYSKIWSSKSPVATFPNLAFQTGAGSFQFRPQPTQTSVRPPVQLDLPQNTFCQPKSEPENDFLRVTPLSSVSASWEETSPREGSKATFPQQIFQVIQNLLPWRQRREPVKTFASSVVVMSTHSSEPIADKHQGEGQRVKRGFWRYSQLLTHRAFAAPSKPEPEKFQVWVKERLIAEFPSQKQAELMAERLKQFLSNSSDPYLNASPVLPTIWEGQPALKVGDRLLFKIDDALATDLNHNAQLLVIEWANNLRMALGKVSLKLADAQKHMYNLVETPRTFKGNASWYGAYFHGRLTATGETYNQHELTAAHPSLPFDTYLRVKNLNNGASVIVRINDRGPYISNRHLDLSREAARCIDSEKVGVIPFEAVIMQPSSVPAHEYLTKNK